MNLKLTQRFEFDGRPHGQLGLSPASFEGFWTHRFWMDEPVRLVLDSEHLHLVALNNETTKTWGTNLIQKVNIGFPNSSQPHIEIYFRDGSMINVYQFGLLLSELKALQHRLRSFITKN